MKSLKRIGLIGVFIMILVSLTACSESMQENKTWKVGHVRPAGTAADNDLHWFADKVKEETNGAINIEVYPASQLGDYEVVQERIGLGDIEMQLAPAGTSVDKALGISLAPYLVTNWEQARKMYAHDSELMEAVSELFKKQGIKLLAAYPKYFGGIALAVEPKEPGDPNVNKNIKIRVPGMKSFELTAQALGYLATPIPYAEAFTSMQTGIVDGVIGSGAEGYYASFRDLTKYYLPVNDHFEMWYLYMNDDLWNSLSDEEKKVIQDASNKLEAERFKQAEQLEQKYMDKLRAEGTKVYNFTDEELNAFAKKVRDTVWPNIKEEYGVELFERITKDIK